MTAPTERCRRRTDCRLCGGRRLENAFSLTATPPANAFVPASELSRPQETFPLDLFFCTDCTHLQLLDIVDPTLLFEHYVYVSGTSPVFVDHFRRYAEDMILRAGLKPGDLVIDIGSNDGTLLRFFKESGMRVLGVDPAREIAAAATASGIETINDFFSMELAGKIRSQHGPAQLLTANNVFAHADDLKGLLAGARSLLAPDGLYAFEVSYLADVYEKLLFDTIYHEHLAYHAVRPLTRFFKENGMELVDSQRIDPHGGSLRGLAQLSGGPRKVGDSVAELLAREEKLGLGNADTYRGYAARINDLKTRLQSMLQGFKSQGKTLAGFGAPAKATTLMYHFGLGPDLVEFIIDDSPLKQGLYSPGLHIPVLPSKTLYEKKPDHLLILAWNFADSIMAKHQAYQAAGGRFIVPLPELTLR